MYSFSDQIDQIRSWELCQCNSKGKFLNLLTLYQKTFCRKLLKNSMKRWMRWRKYPSDQNIYFGELVLSNLFGNIDQYSIAQSLFKTFGAWKLSGLRWNLFYTFVFRVPCSWALFAFLIELPVSWNTSLKYAQTYLTRKTELQLSCAQSHMDKYGNRSTIFKLFRFYHVF